MDKVKQFEAKFKELKAELDEYLDNRSQKNGRGLGRAGGKQLNLVRNQLRQVLRRLQTITNRTKLPVLKEVTSRKTLPVLKEKSEKINVVSGQQINTDTGISIEKQYQIFADHYGLKANAKNKAKGLEVFKQMSETAKTLAYYCAPLYKKATKRIKFLHIYLDSIFADYVQELKESLHVQKDAELIELCDAFLNPEQESAEDEATEQESTEDEADEADDLDAFIKENS